LNIWEIPLGSFERRLTLIDGREALSLEEVSLQDGLLIIELREDSMTAEEKEVPESKSRLITPAGASVV
jgi:hypothetical protein